MGKSFEIAVGQEVVVLQSMGGVEVVAQAPASREVEEEHRDDGPDKRSDGVGDEVGVAGIGYAVDPLTKRREEVIHGLVDQEELFLPLKRRLTCISTRRSFLWISDSSARSFFAATKLACHSWTSCRRCGGM